MFWTCLPLAQISRVLTVSYLIMLYLHLEQVKIELPIFFFFGLVNILIDESQFP